MANQKTFKKAYCDLLTEQVKSGESILLYGEESFPYDESQVVMIPALEHPEGLLEKLVPTTDGDCESAIALYEAYPGLSPVLATDKSFWAYLSHVELYEYLRKRNPKVLQPESVDSTYILSRWLLGNDWIKRACLPAFWWIVYLTVDNEGIDKYRYTRYFFSNYDFRTNFLRYNITKHKEAVIGYFDFLIDNPEVMRNFPAERNRFITKHLNKLGGSRLLSTLPRDFFYNELTRIKPQILAVTSTVESDSESDFED